MHVLCHEFFYNFNGCIKQISNIKYISAQFRNKLHGNFSLEITIETFCIIYASYMQRTRTGRAAVWKPKGASSTSAGANKIFVDG